MATQNPNDPDPLVTLPLSAIRSIMFGAIGDSNKPSIRPLMSPLPGESSLIEVTHWAIGRVLKDLDPSEFHFHVELFPPEEIPGKPLSHAEIWLGWEWTESNTKYYRGKSTANTARSVNLLRGELQKEIIDELSVFRDLPEGYCRMMAIRLTEDMEALDSFMPLAKSLGFDEVLRKYQDEYNKLKAAASGAAAALEGEPSEISPSIQGTGISGKPPVTESPTQEPITGVSQD